MHFTIPTSIKEEHGEHHAMIEEQVMYPAALLVGEHVRLQLRSPRS